MYKRQIQKNSRAAGAAQYVSKRHCFGKAPNENRKPHRTAVPVGRMACPAALCPGRNQPFKDFHCNPAGLSPVWGWMQAMRSAAWKAFAVSCLCHAPALGDHLKPLLFSSKRTASSGFSSKYILSRLSSLQGSAYPPSNSQPACKEH